MTPTKRNQRPTSIYLRPEDRTLLDVLCKRTGLGPTAVMRLGLRALETQMGANARAGEATGQA